MNHVIYSRIYCNKR